MIPNATINGVDLRRKYGLLVKSRSVPLPAPRTNFIAVPGGNGSLDLSTALTDGDMKFDDRDIEVEFTSPGDYNVARDQLAKLLHGAEVRLTFSDDTEHYFTGRAWVDSWGYDSSDVGAFTVRMQARPYRYLLEPTRLVYQPSLSSYALNITNRRMWTYATFTSTGNVTITKDGVMWSLTAGVPRTIKDLVLKEGDNRVTFSTGTARVTIEYQEGEL